MLTILVSLGLGCAVPTQEAMRHWIDQAARLSDYPWPTKEDYQIRVVGQDGKWFAQFYGGGEAAIYWPGVIIANCDKLETYPQVYQDSVWLHESVHHLQYLNGQMTDYACRTVSRLETEAYKVQSAYLVSHGEPAVTGPSMRCSGR